MTVMLGRQMRCGQVRALCYAAMMILIAMDWTFIGGGLFLALMQFAEG